jgi:hypothetical protein
VLLSLEGVAEVEMLYLIPLCFVGHGQCCKTNPGVVA